MEAARPAVRVLIVDDQSMIRGGFEALLDAQDGITVVGTAADGSGIAEAVQELRPDVVLMDIRMPHVGGLEATRTVLEMPGTPPKIIMLTTFDADEYVFAALRAGAIGYLLKDNEDAILAASAHDLGRPGLETEL